MGSAAAILCKLAWPSDPAELGQRAGGRAPDLPTRLDGSCCGKGSCSGDAVQSWAAPAEASSPGRTLQAYSGARGTQRQSVTTVQELTFPGPR